MDAIKALGAFCSRIAESVMAGSGFGSRAGARPLVQRQGEVGRAQNGEAEARCISKSELDVPGLQLCRLAQQEWCGDGARRVEQLSGRTRVSGVEAAGDKDFPVWQQSGDMVGTAADQGKRW